MTLENSGYYMATWRDEIPLRVLKNISPFHEWAHRVSTDDAPMMPKYTRSYF